MNCGGYATSVSKHAIPRRKKARVEEVPAIVGAADVSYYERNLRLPSRLCLGRDKKLTGRSTSSFSWRFPHMRTCSHLNASNAHPSALCGNCRGAERIHPQGESRSCRANTSVSPCRRPRAPVPGGIYHESLPPPRCPNDTPRTPWAKKREQVSYVRYQRGAEGGCGAHSQKVEAREAQLHLLKF